LLVVLAWLNLGYSSFLSPEHQFGDSVNSIETTAALTSNTIIVYFVFLVVAFINSNVL